MRWLPYRCIPRPQLQGLNSSPPNVPHPRGYWLPTSRRQRMLARRSIQVSKRMKIAALAPSVSTIASIHSLKLVYTKGRFYIVMIGSRAKVQPTIQMAGRLRSELVQASLWQELDADLKFPSRCGNLHITMS